MKAQLLARLAAMDRRAVTAIAAALLLFVLLEAWLLVLRAPLAEWRTLVAQREHTQTPQTGAALQAEIEQARRAIAQAEAALQATGLPRADDDMVLHLITTLDGIARPHAVTLGPVRAGERRIEGELKVLSFDAEARGNYLALIAWLREAEERIAPLKATELKLDASDEGRQVTLRVKFTAYLPMPDTPGAPR